MVKILRGPLRLRASNGNMLMLNPAHKHIIVTQGMMILFLDSLRRLKQFKVVEPKISDMKIMRLKDIKIIGMR